MDTGEYARECLNTYRDLLGISISIIAALAVAEFLMEHSMVASGTAVVLVTGVYLVIRLVTCSDGE